MKHRIYTIRDSKTETYSQPFVQMTDGQATRTVADMVNNPEHPIGKHPEDYVLFRIGTFEDNEGKIETEDSVSVANAIDLQESRLSTIQ